MTEPGAAVPLPRSLPGARIFRAPGRVNLIGGHVDYHDGLVVAMAIDRDVRVQIRRRDDERVVVQSAEQLGTVDVAADGVDDPAAVAPAWGQLVGGIVRVLAELGRPPIGADVSIESALPIGGGLSSSAAFEIAIASALAAIADFTIEPFALAKAAQAAEHLGTGVPCGIQDQMASVIGGTILLDCRTLHVERLPIPDSLAVVVVNSGVERTLATSPWTQRRAETFAAAAALGVRVLRDVRLDQVADHRRARHVVSEIARVEAFAAAGRIGDYATMGRLMCESHASSRDDMESSTPELDEIVDALVEAGAFGARLTGGGFGGCCVAIADAGDADNIARIALDRYRNGLGANRAASATVVAVGSASGEVVNR